MGLPAFRGDSPLRAWAYRIAWNASHSFRAEAWQRRRRRLETTAASRLAAALSRSAAPSADEQRLAAMAAQVSQALQGTSLYTELKRARAVPAGGAA